MLIYKLINNIKVLFKPKVRQRIQSFNYTHAIKDTDLNITNSIKAWDACGKLKRKYIKRKKD